MVVVKPNDSIFPPPNKDEDDEVSVENNYGKLKATTQRKDNNYGDKSDKPTWDGAL